MCVEQIFTKKVKHKIIHVFIQQTVTVTEFK